MTTQIKLGGRGDDRLAVIEYRLAPPSVAEPVWTERRRSHRVDLASGLSTELRDLGHCRLIEVSLGGGILETEQRLRVDETYQLRLVYEDAQTVLQVRACQSSLHELFYCHKGNSRVSYRSRIICSNLSIEALNLLYRIMRDYWSPYDLAD